MRSRALEYLQEGDATPILERLLRERHFDLEEWSTALAEMNSPRDAAEWRGAAARLLQSDPEHTGLLLVRVLAELATIDPDLRDVESNLTLMIERASNRFGLSRVNLEEIGGYVMSASSTAKSGLAVCAEVLYRNGLCQGGVRDQLREVAVSDTDDPISSAAYLGIELAELFDFVVDADEYLKRRMYD